MKRCPQCGKNCPDEYKFCSSCGGKLPDMQAQNQPVKPPKKKRGKIGIIAVAAAVVLIGSVAVRTRNTGAGEGIVYMSDGHYYSLKDTCT